MGPNNDREISCCPPSTSNEDNSWPKPWLPFRYLVMALIFMGPAITFAVRTVIHVALLAMVNNPDPNENSNETRWALQDEIGTFNWDQKEQGFILGAYFYTYAGAQIAAGIITDRFNPVHLTIITQLIASACSFLSPIAAQTNIYYLVSVRMALGFAHGITLPSCYILIERWLPPGEVSLAQSLVCVGCNFGVVVSMPLTAWLCENGFAGGWPSAFCIMGMANLVYILIWWILMTPDPSSNPFVSNYEKSHLEMVINKKPKIKIATPWFKMISSMSLWTVMLSRGLEGLVYYTINSKIPFYLETVLNYKLQGDGQINSIFYMVLCSSQLICGPLSKFIITKGWFSVTVTRKVFESIALIGSGLCLLSITYLSNQPNMIIVSLTLSMFFLGFVLGGNIPIVPEMAPHLVGTAFGFANTLGSSAGFVAPQVIGFIIAGDAQSQSKWNIVFYIITGLQFFGAAMFVLFATAKPQPWGKVNTNDDQEPIVSNEREKV